MERRTKVELFEQIRREYEFGVGTIRAVAHKLGVHRRLVRQALTGAEPPERKRVKRERPAGAITGCRYRRRGISRSSTPNYWPVVTKMSGG